MAVIDDLDFRFAAGAGLRARARGQVVGHGLEPFVRVADDEDARFAPREFHPQRALVRQGAAGDEPAVGARVAAVNEKFLDGILTHGEPPPPTKWANQFVGGQFLAVPHDTRAPAEDGQADAQGHKARNHERAEKTGKEEQGPAAAAGAEFFEEAVNSMPGNPKPADAKEHKGKAEPVQRAQPACGEGVGDVVAHGFDADFRGQGGHGAILFGESSDAFRFNQANNWRGEKKFDKCYVKYYILLKLAVRLRPAGVRERVL